MGYQVFISYSRYDKNYARRIVKALGALGVKCFLDQDDLAVGDSFIERIEEAMSECLAVVVIISPASLKSRWVNYEIGQAKAKKKPILPFLTTQGLDLPDFLAGYQVGYKVSDIKMRIKKLLNVPPPPPPPPSPKDYIKDITVSEINLIEVPGATNLYSSFQPDGEKGKFLRLKIPTTSGWIFSAGEKGNRKHEKTENQIYIIRDPIRAFEIQIGEMRARRPGGDPGLIMLDGDLDQNTFKKMYKLMMHDEDTWMRMVLAEISPNPEVLKYIHDNDPDETVRKITTRNPNSSDDLKIKGCLFCDYDFIHFRERGFSEDALIIANDYPFGPFFHYIIMPKEPIHSWDSVEERHLVGMNLLIKEFLDTEKRRNNLNGSAGVRIGFNSSIRHLVVGQSTRTSAGASIAHVHKQMWGMAPGSINLGDHLSSLCAAYSRRGKDYLRSYHEALKDAGLVLWEDDNVALYIPIGQISMHELQVMMLRENTGNYLDLSEDEIRSLSRAELMVTKIYGELEINSFNEVMISKPFNSQTQEGFRLIFAFITREIDFAVSELNLLYVVDKHPYDTLDRIQGAMPDIRASVTGKPDVSFKA